MTLEQRLALAREIAARTKPRFVDIPRVARGTIYNALIKEHPEVETLRAAALAAKEEQSRLVGRRKR